MNNSQLVTFIRVICVTNTQEPSASDAMQHTRSSTLHAVFLVQDTHNPLTQLHSVNVQSHKHFENVATVLIASFLHLLKYQFHPRQTILTYPLDLESFEVFRQRCPHIFIDLTDPRNAKQPFPCPSLTAYKVIFRQRSSHTF